MKNKNCLVRNACEVCESEDYKVLFSESYENPVMAKYLEMAYHEIPSKLLKGMNTEIVKCLDCGFVWQRYILNEELTQHLYDQWEVRSEEQSKEGYSYFQQIVLAINNRFKKRPQEIDVLDVGFGRGELLVIAKGVGNNVYGIESSPTLQASAIAKGINVLEWEEIKKYKFDLICCEQLLEHVPNPSLMLATLGACLKKDGLMHIAVPNCKKIPMLGRNRSDISVEHNISNVQRIIQSGVCNDEEIAKVKQLLTLMGLLGGPC